MLMQSHDWVDANSKDPQDSRCSPTYELFPIRSLSTCISDKFVKRPDKSFECYQLIQQKTVHKLYKLHKPWSKNATRGSWHRY